MIAELSPTRIQSLLRTSAYGRSLRALALTDSTNDDARRDAASGAPDGHVVLADAQRSGRGSHGRRWTSPPGSDLYVSIVARPHLPLSELPPLTLAVGLAVAEVADALLAQEHAEAALVKWPNDVWIAGKKCAGILVETGGAEPEQPPAAVIGIGVNVNRLDWPIELRSTATSLRALRPSAAPFDRGLVLAELLHAVERWVGRFVREGGAAVARALDARLALRGTRVRCGEVEGVLLGVAGSGAVRVDTGSGVRELLAGRISPCD